VEEALEMLFDECCTEIENFYENHPELKLGWRFIYGPKRTLENSNGFILFGLNPGGKFFSKEHSSEKGNAYLIEDWQSNLQKQIKEFFEIFCKRKKLNQKFFLNNTLTSNFIFFRSPDFDSLPHKEDCVNFSRTLWQKIFKLHMPRVILCIGNGKLSAYSFVKQLFECEASILNETKRLLYNTFYVKSFNVNKCGIEVVVVGLPHLSRCHFINNPKLKNQFEEIMKLLTQKY